MVSRLFPLTTFILITVSLLAGCSESVLRNVKLMPLKAEALQAPDNETVLNAGRGGGSLSLRLQYKPRVPDFKTMLGPCTINNDLKSFRVFLINGTPSLGSVSPLGLLNNITGRLVGSVMTVNKNGISSPSGAQTITIKNVGTGTYYVAMAAFNDFAGAGSNITSLIALLTSANINLTGQVSVTDSGGEPGAPGRVSIGPAPDYAIQNGSGTPLTLTLNLETLLCP